MTQYENLSLALLAAIAQGIGLHVTQDNMDSGDLREEHSEQVLAWQKNLTAILQNVAAATRRGGEQAG